MTQNKKNLSAEEIDRQKVKEYRQKNHIPLNNTDTPSTPPEKRALNNPSGEDESLSGYSGDDPLAEV